MVVGTQPITSTERETRKRDLRDFIIKLKKKEELIRCERQRLEAELLTLCNRELIDKLKNGDIIV